jgi:hypothetical protein
VKLGAGRRDQPDCISGVLRDLRFKERDSKHGVDDVSG